MWCSQSQANSPYFNPAYEPLLEFRTLVPVFLRWHHDHTLALHFFARAKGALSNGEVYPSSVLAAANYMWSIAPFTTLTHVSLVVPTVSVWVSVAT
jgi:hypothetical protein